MYSKNFADDIIDFSKKEKYQSKSHEFNDEKLKISENERFTDLLKSLSRHNKKKSIFSYMKKKNQYAKKMSLIKK